MEKRQNRMGGVTSSCLVLLLVNSSLALAQLPTATILGTVQDASGAVVPGAAIMARNLDTGQSRTASSGADGSFRFAALPVGNYEVRAEHPGFQSEVRRGLTLTVAQEAVVNFSLEVGTVQQEVAVTAEAPLVNTTSGSLGGLVSEQRMAELPLNGRNYADLTLLQPGVTQYRNFSPTSGTYTGLLYSSNGAGFRSNSYLLDGANMANIYGSSSASLTSTTLGVEGIREYRVITNSFSAEYGMRMGSQMIMVSKSGGNAFHGSAFEYLRNSALDARNFFDYKTVASQRRLPAFTRNNFGGSAGGPIKKDKTFFFGAYEEIQARTGITIVSNVMAPGCHGAGGTVITNAACPQLGTVSQVTIAPQIAPILALYPLPNLPNNQLTFPYSQPEADYYGQMRVDHTFWANDTLFGRYTIQDSALTMPDGGYPGLITSAASRGQYATLSETHIFSPALLSTARFSFSRSPSDRQFPPQYVGPQYSFVPGLPIGQLSSGGVTAFGVNVTLPTRYMQNLFTWSDDLFYTRGRHSLKFGVLFNHYQQRFNSGNQTRGTISFNNMASFLQAQANRFSLTLPGSILYRMYHLNALGFYVQDDLRLTSRLTLNLGLRYEPTGQTVEVSGRGSNIRDIQHDAGPTLGSALFVNPSLRNFSPRFGFAWDVMGDGKTAVRGGFGLLYDVAQFSTGIGQDLPGMPPFSSQATFINPPAINPPSPANITIPLTIPTTLSTIAYKLPDYHMQQPHMLQYNLTVERQLPGSMALSLGYAGSRGINIVKSTEGNPTVPQGIPVNGVCVARPASQAYNINTPSCWMGRDPRTNPNFGTVTYQTAGSNSWYNALQFGLTKRLSRGLEFQSSYTWSKAIDETQGEGSGDAILSDDSDPTHRNVDRGLTTFDITQNWRFNAIYNLPHSSSLSGVAGSLLNGWWVSGILSMQSGYPFSVQVSGDRSRSGQGGDRPNLVPGRNAANITSGTSPGCLGVPAGTPLGTLRRYFDPCAFTLQPLGFLGTAGRDILRGPGFANLDFSVVKDTALRFLGEGGKLQFRVEVFNILNRANFALPRNSNVVFAAQPASPAGNSEPPLPTAGVITQTTNASRQIQFALKLLF